MRTPPTIRVDLDDIAGSVGDQLAAHRLLEPARDLVDRMDRQLEALPGLLREVIPLVVEGSAGPWPRRKAEAWSVLIGRPWQQILIANCTYELAIAGGLIPRLCAVLMLPTPHRPVFARNLEWDPMEQLARASCRLEY